MTMIQVAMLGELTPPRWRTLSSRTRSWRKASTPSSRCSMRPSRLTWGQPLEVITGRRREVWRPACRGGGETAGRGSGGLKE